MDQNTENVIAESLTVLDFPAGKHKKRMLKAMVSYLARKHQIPTTTLQEEAFVQLLTLPKYALTAEEIAQIKAEEAA